MSVFVFTNNFKDSEMFLHLFPCWWYSKMLNTHNNICNIASDNVYDNWRQLNPTVKNWMYFIQTQAEALTVCESNFEKSHLHKCTFGDDWEVKIIYTVTYTISPLKECRSLKCYHSSYNYYVWDKIYLCRTQKYVLHSIYIPLRLYLKNLWWTVLTMWQSKSSPFRTTSLVYLMICCDRTLKSGKVLWWT